MASLPATTAKKNAKNRVSNAPAAAHSGRKDRKNDKTPCKYRVFFMFEKILQNDTCALFGTNYKY